jgi:hypothetical protein
LKESSQQHLNRAKLAVVSAEPHTKKVKRLAVEEVAAVSAQPHIKRVKWQQSEE